MKSTNQPGYKHLFGPVPSRRLGMSLGVDLIPFKTCSLNCVYCECGTTTVFSNVRAEYIPTAEIISELDLFLSNKPELDVVTFAGSGEPTLHSGLKEIISFLSLKYPRYKTAILTNSTLLYDKDVRDAIMPVNYILPSLDAVSQNIMDKINRPYKGITAESILNGIRLLSSEFKGTIWIEIFIIEGINDTPEELRKFKDFLSSIRFDRIQLNSLDRPGTCLWVKPASLEKLHEIADYFSPLPVEIIARTSAKSSQPASGDISTFIMPTISRRPCTASDISAMYGVSMHTTMEILNNLIDKKQIVTDNINGNIFYRLPSNS